MVLLVACGFPKALRWNSECPIKLARCVFPCDNLCQLNYFVVVKVLAQLREYFVANVSIRERHRIRVRKCHNFRLFKQRAIMEIPKCEKLVVTNVQLAADRSVDVLSEYAVVENGHATIHQNNQRVREQT